LSFIGIKNRATPKRDIDQANCIFDSSGIYLFWVKFANYENDLFDFQNGWKSAKKAISYYPQFNNKRAKQVTRQYSLTTVAVLIAFVLFANYENLRDQFGERYIQGYQVTYYTDSDDYGRPTRESDIHAHNFSAQVFLWLAQWVLIAFCIGVPILTWKVSSIAVAALENQKIKDDKF
jgi:hypothetical protein